MPQFKVYGERDGGKAMKGIVRADDAEHAESLAKENGITVHRVKRIVEPATALATQIAKRETVPPVPPQHVETRRVEPAPEPAPVYQPSPPQPQTIVNVVQTNHATSIPKWSGGVAAILSLFIPGLGQIYKGQAINGIVWFIVVFIGYMLLIVPGLILHIFCIIGAASGDPYK